MPIMKARTLSLVAVALAVALGLPSCSGGPVKVTVTGTPGARFTVRHRLGGTEGCQATSIAGVQPANVLEFPRLPNGLECDVEKADPANWVRVDVLRGRERILITDSPAGWRGVRFGLDDRGWRSETYR
jgi:hypothetical protein